MRYGKRMRQAADRSDKVNLTGDPWSAAANEYKNLAWNDSTKRRQKRKQQKQARKRNR